MAYVKVSVPRPEGHPGAGIQPKDRVTVIDVEDIGTMPARDDKGVVIADDITLKNDAKGVALYLTPGTVELTSASDGDPDAEGFTPSIKFSHPGNEQAIREFKTAWVGKNCIVLVQYCKDGKCDMLGSPCNPMRLTASYTGNKDSNLNELTFTQVSRGDDIAIYEGVPVPTADDPVPNQS
ncbi:MAG: hypothetical protein HUK01_03650 [Bacteroidaceae bacterium]|nr:hypothetical protein [Bacteroidaceae bacterium]